MTEGHTTLLLNLRAQYYYYSSPESNRESLLYCLNVGLRIFSVFEHLIRPKTDYSLTEYETLTGWVLLNLIGRITLIMEQLCSFDIKGFCIL
jgi:hypothetical protein